MSNDFIRLMADPAYQQREREAREDADRRHRERVARNTAPPPMTRQERLRRMITDGREFNFESAVRSQQRDRYMSDAGTSGYKHRRVRDEAPVANQEQAHERR